MRLTDTLPEQALLEAILEASKPPLPAGAGKLHYLLATPFRYRPRAGSRFRAPFEAGVWYGAEHLRSALAEKGYWRLRFLLDSPATPDLKPVPHTAFNVSVRGKALDLTAPPLARDREKWVSRTDYGATQALAAAARAADIELIRYASVRDPQHAACVALPQMRAIYLDQCRERGMIQGNIKIEPLRHWRGDEPAVVRQSLDS